MTILVSDVMQHNVSTITTSDCLAFAMEMMVQKRIRHLPVLEGGALVGILSERDVLRYGTLHQVTARDTVRAAMSCELEVAIPEESLARASERMVKRRIGCLPVLAGSKLVGIVTTTDALRARYDNELPKRQERHHRELPLV